MPEVSTTGPARAGFLRLRVLILLGFGLAYAFAVPLFEGADEPAHFARAYGIAEGQWILQDHPRALVVFIRDHIHAGLTVRGEETPLPVLVHIEALLDRHQDRIPNIAFNSAQYSPVPYLFHAAIIRMLMIVEPAPNTFRASLYVCRSTSVFLFALSIYLCSRLFPPVSRPFFWIAATPMALSQSALLSVDGVLLCASMILLCASFANVNRIPYACCLIIPSFFLMMTKPPYVPLLAVPVVAFCLDARNRKDPYRLASVVSALTIAVFGAVIWNGIAHQQGVYRATFDAIQKFAHPGVNPAEQVEWMRQFPFHFLTVILHTLRVDGIRFYHQMVGVLGWLDTPVPFWAAIGWGGGMMIAVFTADRPESLSRSHSIVSAAACIVSAVLAFILVFAAVYIVWVPLGSGIGYLQGRYLHPIAAALCLGFVLLKGVYIGAGYVKASTIGLLLASLLLNGVGLLTVMDRFPW